MTTFEQFITSYQQPLIYVMAGLLFVAFLLSIWHIVLALKEYYNKNKL